MSSKNNLHKGIFLIAVSQFGLTFSFNFMFAFMPFYVAKISTLTHRETMVWVGMILGAPHIITALIAPLWGGLTSDFVLSSLKNEVSSFTELSFCSWGLPIIFTFFWP